MKCLDWGLYVDDVGIKLEFQEYSDCSMRLNLMERTITLEFDEGIHRSYTYFF